MFLLVLLLLFVFVILPATFIGGIIGSAIAAYRNRRILVKDARNAQIRAEAYRLPPRTTDIVQCESENC